MLAPFRSDRVRRHPRNGLGHPPPLPNGPAPNRQRSPRLRRLGSAALARCPRLRLRGRERFLRRFHPVAHCRQPGCLRQPRCQQWRRRRTQPAAERTKRMTATKPRCKTAPVTLFGWHVSRPCPRRGLGRRRQPRPPHDCRRLRRLHRHSCRHRCRPQCCHLHQRRLPARLRRPNTQRRQGPLRPSRRPLAAARAPRRPRRLSAPALGSHLPRPRSKGILRPMPSPQLPPFRPLLPMK